MSAATPYNVRQVTPVVHFAQAGMIATQARLINQTPRLEFRSARACSVVAQTHRPGQEIGMWFGRGCLEARAQCFRSRRNVA